MRRVAWRRCQRRKHDAGVIAASYQRFNVVAGAIACRQGTAHVARHLVGTNAVGITVRPIAAGNQRRGPALRRPHQGRVTGQHRAFLPSVAGHQPVKGDGLWVVVQADGQRVGWRLDVDWKESQGRWWLGWWPRGRPVAGRERQQQQKKKAGYAFPRRQLSSPRITGCGLDRIIKSPHKQAPNFAPQWPRLASRLAGKLRRRHPAHDQPFNYDIIVSHRFCRHGQRHRSGQILV